ncbi:MAG: hypothetical protein MRY57_02270, partial [Candidatus Pacebacteria bacterium]|nr:hypothetical protein [Candidatus Paceibacterota bacterium]
TKEDSEENTNEEVIEEENPVVESDTEVEVTEETKDEEIQTLADILLESLEIEVEEIKAFEALMQKEITQGEEDESDEIIVEEKATEEELVQENLDVPTLEVEKDGKETILESESIDNDIKSLQDILDLKQEIILLRGEAMNVDTPPNVDMVTTQDEEITFNEETLLEEVELLIEEKKYKKAFVKLQTLLEHIREELILEKAETELGISKETEVLDTEILGSSVTEIL